MERIMMEEYLTSDSSKRNGKHKHPGVIESSMEGLLYTNVPESFYSRNLIPYIDNKLDTDCLIHHVSNTYVNNPHVPLGKQNVDTIMVKI